MSIKRIPKSAREFKTASRDVLEKYKDLTFGKKCSKLYSKKTLSKDSCNLVLCLEKYVECLNVGFKTLNENQFVKHLLQKEIRLVNILKERVILNSNVNKPVPIKVISPILKNHTNFFNYLIATKTNPDSALDEYLKFRLSAISIWNNYWNIN